MAAGEVSFSIDSKDLERLRAALERKERSLKEKRSTFGKAVVLIDRWVQKNFQLEGRLAYSGVGWQPLARSTIERKASAWARSGVKIYTKKGSPLSKRLASKVEEKVRSGDTKWLKRKGISAGFTGYTRGGPITSVNVYTKRGAPISKRLSNKIQDKVRSGDSEWLKRNKIQISKVKISTKRGGQITKKIAGRIAGNKILQDRGWLRSRWRHYYNDQYAIIQSGVDYGIYHDSDLPRKKLPQRKITPTEKQIMPELVKIFGDHVRTSLRK